MWTSLQNYRYLARTSPHLGCLGLDLRVLLNLLLYLKYCSQVCANFGTDDKPKNTKNDEVKQEDKIQLDSNIDADAAKGSFHFLSQLQTAETATPPSIPSIDEIKRDNIKQLR